MAYRFVCPERKKGGKWHGFPGAAAFEGLTLHEVLKKKEKDTSKGKWDPTGLNYIKWILKPKFNWNKRLLDRHVLLYLELEYLQDKGALFWDGGGWWQPELPAMAKTVYREWVQSKSSSGSSITSIPTEDDDAATLSVVAANGGTIQTHEESEAFVRTQQRNELDGPREDDRGAVVGSSTDDADDDTDDDHDDVDSGGEVADEQQQDQGGGFEDDDGDGDGDGCEAVQNLRIKKLTKADVKVAQKKWQSECMLKIKKGELQLFDTKSMPTLMIHPPDPTRVLPFDAANSLLVPITVWSPTESHEKQGVRDVPCVNGGYDHANCTSIGGWRKGRRVRGLRGRDYDVMGRDVTCTCCRAKNRVLKAELKVRRLLSLLWPENHTLNLIIFYSLP